MLRFVLRQLARGPGIPRYPDVADEPTRTFRGAPRLLDAACRGHATCAAVCPTDAIHVGDEQDGWVWRIDRAACTGCGLCVDACPEQALEASQAFELAARSRADLAETVRFSGPHAERAEVAP